MSCVSYCSWFSHLYFDIIQFGAYWCSFLDSVVGSFQLHSNNLHSILYLNNLSLYKVVQIWSGQTVTCLHTNRPGHIWTTLYFSLNVTNQFSHP
jgi:hypothetical protein